MNLDHLKDPELVNFTTTLPDGRPVMVFDHLRDGYGDEKSVSMLAEDVVGEVTGDDTAAKVAGEDARRQWSSREIIAEVKSAALARFGKGPTIKYYHLDNDYQIMVRGEFNPVTERVDAVATLLNERGEVVSEHTGEA